ncbi:TrbI/VirB10 family protein [Caulobacter sp. UNC279MFTsu5.1]|uniref:TrbI/VirB10 family protein n=1 Tax=Caulobacter sp. UNC279MFTsu5.1 TaxID=1502775 RepID=UPI000368160E|nr:TrbI/VirB10 family protein [Caulobacter sp. UNC279MFTsu5.1]SFI56467.1 type IV secretion system protein VirB10 [Caulobacter sp. UNC279MFTsu5.1]
MNEQHHPDAADSPKTLRLRGDAPPVARLSRQALAIGAGVLSTTLVGALFWSLADHHKAAPPVAREPGPVAPPEGVTAQPRDYRAKATPQLGPPLPGDLGRPILKAHNRRFDTTAVTATPAPDSVPARGPAPSAPRASGATHATSGLFFDAMTDRKPQADQAGGAAVTPVVPSADSRTTSPERLATPASNYIVLAGTSISGALVTGLRSDAPGLAVGQVTRDVFDGLGRGVRLIPAGARLIGGYDTEVASGAARLRIKWTRLILPDGRSIVLDDLPAADAQGFAGLQDGVDRHGRAVVGAAALSTVLALGAEAGSSSDDALIEAIRRGGARSVSDVGQQAVSKSLALPPVLTVRPGAPMTVLLARDLVLEPYEEKATR